MDRIIKIKQKWLCVVAYLYLIIPIIIFFGGWLRPCFGVLCSALLLIGFIKIIKNIDKNEYCEIPIKVLIVLACVIFLWILFSGNGDFFSAQRSDLHWRNATFRDLVDYSWPVIYPETKNALVYYFIYWLVPALFGKIFGFFAAKIVLFLWTFLGIYLIVLYLCKILKINTLKKALLLIFVFIVWGGLNVLGQLIAYAIKGNVVGWDVYFVWTDVFTPGFQYTPNNALLEWCYNQVIVPWLATVMFLENKNISNMAYLGLCVLPFAPLPFCGIVILFLAYGVKKFCVIDNRLLYFKNVFSIQNIASIISIVPIFACFFTANSATNGVNGGGIGLYYPICDFTLERWIVFVLFLFIEFGIYSIILYKTKKDDYLFWVVNISLIIIPFIRIGESRDFCMRASIPALFILMIWIIEFCLTQKYLCVKNVMLIASLTVASIGTGVDLWGSLQSMILNNSVRVPADEIYTFSDKNPVPFTLGCNLNNYLTENVNEYFFFDRLSKRKSNTLEYQNDLRKSVAWREKWCEPFSSGHYTIKSAVNESMYLGCDDNIGVAIVKDKQNILLGVEKGYYQIIFEKNGQCLNGDTGVNGLSAFVSPRYNIQTQVWNIKKNKSGYVILFENKYAITYKDNNIVLEEFTGEKEQIWLIEKVNE